MDKGTIFNHLNIKYKDGEFGNKYLIILNNQKGNDPYLCCKTTSVQKYGIEREDCHFNHNIFLLNIKKEPFYKKTWVQFDPNSVFEFSPLELLQNKFKGNIKVFEGVLSIPIVNGIVNCFKKSQDISRYWESLLKK